MAENDLRSKSTKELWMEATKVVVTLKTMKIRKKRKDAGSNTEESRMENKLVKRS